MSARDFAGIYEQATECLFDKSFVLKEKNGVRRFDLDEVSEEEADGGQLRDEKGRLQQAKEKVKAKCAKVGESAWHSHTAFTHPMKGLPAKLYADFPSLRPSITQGYCKFLELLLAHPELTAAHQQGAEKEFRWVKFVPLDNQVNQINILTMNLDMTLIETSC